MQIDAYLRPNPCGNAINYAAKLRKPACGRMFCGGAVQMPSHASKNYLRNFLRLLYKTGVLAFLK
jgi:hypothetical protein